MLTRELGRFELFLDLLYVAILANFAEGLAEHVDGNQLVKYIVRFRIPGVSANQLTLASLYLRLPGTYGATFVKSWYISDLY